MKYQIIGKNISVTQGINDAIESKTSKLDKYFRGRDEVNCRAVVSAHDTVAKIEITIFLKEVTLRAEVSHEDLYAAIDLAIDKLEGQIRKLKTRMDRSNGKMSLGRAIEFENFAIENPAPVEKDVVVRAKSYYLTAMDIEEAIARMEALGHDFFLYLDKDDDRVSVVYIRRDGGYGVIQAENPIK